jgi:calcineurin-like phosphoesterase family protein
MKVFFTSDQHYWHKNVIEYCNRPFSSIEEMNETLIANHNSVVGKEDKVYHLGDFSLSRAAVPQIVPRLNGKHTLIMGNHDHCHPVQCKSDEKKLRLLQYYFDSGFSEIMREHRIETPFGPVLMNHLPYSSGPEERYQTYRPINVGYWLLHGHVHQHWKQKDKMINVGVDVWDFTPITLEKIFEVIKLSSG